MQLASNRPLQSIEVPALWAAVVMVLLLSLVVTINAQITYLSYAGACAILHKSIARWKGWLIRAYLLAIFALWSLRHIPYQVSRRPG